MKSKLLLFVAGLVVLLTNGARAHLEVSGGVSIQAVSDFYEPLEPYGAWVTVGDYGRCWRPADIGAEWRPYAYGHWVWTDLGWYWESDEPWGWACYHYGYWVYDPTYAWIWIPAVDWAPAWVTWRVGGGYIGWAPLAPPHVRVTFGAPRFCFVRATHFREPIRPRTVIVNNTAIFNETKVINNMRREERSIAGGTRQPVVVNEGPGVAPIQQATGQSVATVNVREVAQRTWSKAPAEFRARHARGAATPSPQTTTGTESGPARTAQPSLTTPPAVTPSETPKTTPDRNSVPSDSPVYREKPGTAPVAPSRPSITPTPPVREPRREIPREPERPREAAPAPPRVVQPAVPAPRYEPPARQPVQPIQPTQPPPTYEQHPGHATPAQPEHPSESRGRRDKNEKP